MKMSKLSRSFIILLTIAFFAHVKTDSVCDLHTFLVEVKQDLADNGMLDCQRVIEPPHFVEESEEQKNLRLAAQWDTSCAFEASSNWIESIKKNLGISTLVDSVGEPVKKDFDDQADLCEILRGAVAQNIFDLPDLNMQKIPDDIVDKIDCTGLSENPRKGTRICAANGGSYFQKDSWTIFTESSAIKFGGKPNFVISDNTQEPVRNPYANNSNPIAQNKLIKDLMKFTTDQLDMKQGELANMIDKAEEKEKNPNQQSDEDDENASKLTHVHTKRIPSVKLSNNERDGKFSLIDNGSEEFKVEEPRIIFGFYMTSIKLENKGNAFFKLRYADREMPQSRQAAGDITLYTLSSAFGEVYQPKNGEDKINIEVLYDTTQNASIETDNGEGNFSFGAMTLPKGSVFKKVNSETMEFHKSAKWNIIPNFDLSINNSKNVDVYYLIMYNLSFPIPGSFTLETRMKYGKAILPESSVNCGPTNIIGIHSSMVLKAKPGSNLVSFEYRYDGDSLTLQDFTDPHYSQTITAFELPKNTIVNNYKVKQPAVLDSNGEWKNFQMGASIELKKKQAVLILYSINLKVDKATLAARIRVNTKYKKKSTFISSGQTFANAQGYVASIMKPGKYEIDIDYKSDCKNTFNPETGVLDGQNVSMQIILLD